MLSGGTSEQSGILRPSGVVGEASISTASNQSCMRRDAFVELNGNGDDAGILRQPGPEHGLAGESEEGRRTSFRLTSNGSPSVGSTAEPADIRS